MPGVCFRVIILAILFENVIVLDVVSGKSGEEQVREALERAQKESEEAARKDKMQLLREKEQFEIKHFLKGAREDADGTSGGGHISSDLASVLGRKVAELQKFSRNHGTDNLEVVGSKRATTRTNGAERAGEEKFGEEKEESNDADLERDSDQKMIEMARKLNNLVQKFQRKIGRLSERNHATSMVTHHPRIASFLHAKHSIPAVRYAALLARLKLKERAGLGGSQGMFNLPHGYTDENAEVKSLRNSKKPSPKDSGGIDLMALRKALGLLHKGNPKAKDQKNSRTSYKEDTKLEDRLAMEAEEEKKFSNSDNENYEYGGGEGGGGGGGGGAGAGGAAAGAGGGSSSSSSSSSKGSSADSFSPKEQASKEMQSYNDLISSESNRELSQIQDEITKATQSSMGQVSVVGQKEHVSTENPEPPMGGMGGLGSLEGFGGFGGSFGGGSIPKGAIDSNNIGPQGSSETFPGSDAANAALENALQASAQADMNGESMSTQQQQPPSAEAQTTPEGDPAGNQGGSQEMQPIDIGGGGEQYQDQKSMMGNMGGNNYEGSQSNGMEGNGMMQMGGGGGGGGGGSNGYVTEGK